VSRLPAHRTHALGQVLPLPVSEAELDMLAEAPLMVFGPFGRMARFAASGFSPPEPTGPLRVFGPVVQAVQHGDATQVRSLLAGGADPNVPSPIGGYAALHLAMSRGDVDLMRALVAGGADVRLRTDRGMDPIGLGIVQGAPPAILDELLVAGGAADAVNLDGFGLLHAAAEANRPEIVAWLTGRGLALEARTGRGLTPLHIACGLGHVDAARALIAAGADFSAPSPLGTPREIAEKEGKKAVAELLARPAT
jgi:ankyrin repeat protein